mgnify:CR=1 FL=1
MNKTEWSIVFIVGILLLITAIMQFGVDIPDDILAVIVTVLGAYGLMITR